MTDITPIVEAVIALLAAVITVFVIPYVRAKTTAAQQAQIQSIINVAVYAAEQLCREPGSGEKKKAYVLGYLQERGVTYNASAIDTMIEAAVRQLTIAQK